MNDKTEASDDLVGTKWTTIEDSKAFRQRIADACGTAALDVADKLVPKGSRLAVLVIVQDDDGTSMRGWTNVIDPVGICKNVISGERRK